MASAGLLTQRKLPAPPRHREQRLRAFHYVPVDPIPWCRTSRIRSLETPSRFIRPYYNECRWRRRRQTKTQHKSRRERKGKPPTPADAVDARAAAPGSWQDVQPFAGALQIRDAHSPDLRRIATTSVSPPTCRSGALRQRGDRLGNGGHHVFSGYANAGQALCRRPRRPQAHRPFPPSPKQRFHLTCARWFHRQIYR